MLHSNSRPVVSREFGVVKQISGRLSLPGDGILTSFFHLSFHGLRVVRKLPGERLWDLAREVWMGVKQH